MFKKLLIGLWDVKAEVFKILIIILIALPIVVYAQGKGNEKSVDAKISDWEAKNYTLTEYRKALIKKVCKEEGYEKSDSIISFLGGQQKNFDR